MLLKDNILITPLGLERTLHIYLPDSYHPTKKYGVIYMFDGHNLFVDEDATYGKSWGIKKYFDEHDVEVIVVGIECNHEGNKRLWEFSPYDFKDPYWGVVVGQGKIFVKWMKEELKPYIDAKFSTLTDRQHTAVGGSSMGGLMSIYAGIAASDTFSKAICVSPHYKRMYHKLIKDVKNADVNNVDFYISWGNYECGSQRGLAIYTERNLMIVRELQKGNGVFPHLYVNQDHSESAWENETEIWLKELKIDQWY